jgi:hypothetical protein
MGGGEQWTEYESCGDFLYATGEMRDEAVVQVDCGEENFGRVFRWVLGERHRERERERVRERERERERYREVERKERV